MCTWGPTSSFHRSKRASRWFVSKWQHLYLSQEERESQDRAEVYFLTHFSPTETWGFSSFSGKLWELRGPLPPVWDCGSHLRWPFAALPAYGENLLCFCVYKGGSGQGLLPASSTSDINKMLCLNSLCFPLKQRCQYPRFPPNITITIFYVFSALEPPFLNLSTCGWSRGQCE